jgi:hypothetical protein
VPRVEIEIPKPGRESLTGTERSQKTLRTRSPPSPAFLVLARFLIAFDVVKRFYFVRPFLPPMMMEHHFPFLFFFSPFGTRRERERERIKRFLSAFFSSNEIFSKIFLRVNVLSSICPETPSRRLETEKKIQKTPLSRPVVAEAFSFPTTHINNAS